jgi:hypothetical protein
MHLKNHFFFMEELSEGLLCKKKKKWHTST